MSCLLSKLKYFFLSIGLCFFAGCEQKNIIKVLKGTIKGKTPGWSFKPSKHNGVVYYEFEGYYPDRGGRLESEIFTARKSLGEMAYYRVQFTAQANDTCYWGVDFFGDEGKYAQPDHNDRIWPGKHRYDRFFQASGPVSQLQLFFMSKHGVQISDVTLEKVSFSEVAAWCEGILGSIPSFECQLPDEALTLLPKTKDAIYTGKPLRVLLLGDSIVNDIWNSMFYSRLQRDLPNANLEFICSVRGTTGCWYYQEPKNFESYVVKYKPDMLVIGGISQKNDINAIGKFIDISRQKLGCEILLLSGAYARDTRDYDLDNPGLTIPMQKWSLADEFTTRVINRQIDKTSVMHQTPPDSDLLKLAKNKKVSFVDMTTPTYTYIYASGKPYEFFNRDRVHSNIYGKQINGQILYRLFMKMRD